MIYQCIPYQDSDTSQYESNLYSKVFLYQNFHKPGLPVYFLIAQSAVAPHTCALRNREVVAERDALDV